MGISVTIFGHTFSAHVDITCDGTGEPGRDSDLYSATERSHPDDVSELAELDARRPLGFYPEP